MQSDYSANPLADHASIKVLQFRWNALYVGRSLTIFMSIATAEKRIPEIWMDGSPEMKFNI